MKLSAFTNKTKYCLSGILAGLAFTTAVEAKDLESVTMCAFTLTGEGGPEFELLKDYQTSALSWGVDLKLKSYMNEKIVVEELKAGECDIANMTSMQARQFNKFTGTLDAPATMPTYDHLRIVLQTLAKPSAAKYMREGKYEIIGIQPAGAIYIFTNDRSIRSLSDLAGKKMAILDSMPEMRQLVLDLGMTPVSSTVTNVFQKFNNGAIDVTGGPAIAYEMMELYKGLEPNGGILDEPIVQGNVQFVARHKALPEGFAQKSREYFLGNFDESLEIIRTAKENIPDKWWIAMPEERRDEYNTETRRVRMDFKDRGIYSGKMLTLLRKVRCNLEPTLAECTSASVE